jgi:shikimate dehydrogenase
VNTVVNDDGYLKGYNTDWLGTVTPLEKHTNLKDKKIALIGAGGAARGIAFGVLEKGAHLKIYNRTIEKAKNLADELSKNYINVDFASLDQIDEINAANIIINATSIGMAPYEDKSLIPKDLITADHIIFDAVYTPYKTKLLTEAESQGATIIPGLEMLLYQGTAQFSLYTGVKAPEDIMRQSLIEHFNLKP